MQNEYTLLDWEKLEQLFQELIELQNKRLLTCGRQIIPGLTSDDLLQPNDFLELENHPLFRYEEGVLAGMLSAHTALKALLKEIN